MDANEQRDESRGLYRKFEVARTDGSSESGGKHHGCEYFVLDTSHDPAALPALAAYAAAVEATHPALAADLRQRYALARQAAVKRLRHSCETDMLSGCPACDADASQPQQGAVAWIDPRHLYSNCLKTSEAKGEKDVPLFLGPTIGQQAVDGMVMVQVADAKRLADFALREQPATFIQLPARRVLDCIAALAAHGKGGTRQECGCLRCAKEGSVRTMLGGVELPPEMVRMYVCAKCGNKRCPHSDDHRNTCTNSNESGQPGSRYK